MKAVSFLRSWVKISVCPPCLSLPAPNRYKDQPYRRYLQLPVCFTRPGAAEGHYMSSLLTLQGITSCVSHGLETWWFNTWWLNTPETHHVRVKQSVIIRSLQKGNWRASVCSRILGYKEWNKKKPANTNICWCCQLCLPCNFFTAVIYSWTDLDSTGPGFTYSCIPKYTQNQKALYISVSSLRMDWNPAYSCFMPQPDLIWTLELFICDHNKTIFLSFSHPCAWHHGDYKMGGNVRKWIVDWSTTSYQSHKLKLSHGEMLSAQPGCWMCACFRLYN